MQNKICLYVISGFLGSGKTTFLQKMIDAFPGKKVGVLVNELGQTGIDTKRIKRQELQMVELTNGSIYCACLKGDFIKALIQMSEQQIDVLLIENSGMADPANIHRVLSELKGLAKRPYDYCGSICIIDAVSFLRHVRVLVSVTNQVKAANTVLVNKSDLVDQTVIAQIHQKIEEINPQARIIDTVYANTPQNEILRSCKDNAFDEETSNKCYNKPLSYMLTWNQLLSTETLFLFMKAVADEMYRMKGNALTKEGWVQMDAVEDRVEIRPSSSQTEGKSQLIVICKEREPQKEWLSQVFLKICKVEAEITL